MYFDECVNFSYSKTKKLGPEYNLEICFLMELYNDLLKMYFNEYVNFSYSKTRKLSPEYDPKILFLNDYNYDFLV